MVVLVEASEESGSPDLPAYMEHLKERIGLPHYHREYQSIDSETMPVQATFLLWYAWTVDAVTTTNSGSPLPSVALPWACLKCPS